MITADVIIVGGGPAGSTCAWKLKQGGMKTILLDKEQFPRLKLCAGWITPKVIKDLQIDPEVYPGHLVHFDRLIFHFWGRRLKVRTNQYAIRRIEFDDWLLKRAGVPVFEYRVQTIRKEDGDFIIDETFRSKYLVGAGGTHCPVYRQFFEDINPRADKELIITLEEEFKFNSTEKDCFLWFFDNQLPGYTWFVPKGDGVINVGVGGKYGAMKSRGQNIREHWAALTTKLEKLGLVNNYTYQPKGHPYYIRNAIQKVQLDQAYIIGDAAGLATRDMGEGIGPAIESAILAAETILNNKRYSLKSVTRTSIDKIIFSGKM